MPRTQNYGQAPFLFIYGLFAPTPLRSFASHIGELDPTVAHIILAAAFGMLGSVVSLLLRLSEFESTKGRSRTFLTLTGATLPIVGGAFGAFVAILFSSKVVNIKIGDTSSEVWLYLVIGFLSGFSERFSRGFISAAERQLGHGVDTTTSKPRKAPPK
jgi:hypothetical protein